MNATDRALISSFREITSMADRINLPGNIVDKAKANFKEVYESKSLKGRSNDAIAAACLYIACRQDSVPRTFKVSSISTASGALELNILTDCETFFLGNLCNISNK